MARPPRSKPDGSKAAPNPAARALRLLARREHTRLELARKLERDIEDPLQLQALLDDFAARGWLSEARAVDQLVHAKRGRFGPAYIRRALAKRGVAEELIGPALETLRAHELETARSIWARRFGAPAVSVSEQARQVRFLQSRGFSVEVAMRVARGGGLDADQRMDGD